MSQCLDQVLTVAQMQAAEKAMVDAGTSVEELMQRAGEGAAEWVWRIAAGGSVTVLCGPGNNGGDGYVIAEVLRARGIETRVIAPFDAKDGAAAKARAAFQGEIFAGDHGLHGHVLVDCLFGYGLSRGLGGDLVELLEGLAARHHKLVAIDVPSGVASDTGQLLSPVPDYDLTLSLGAWKQAHFLMPGKANMGEVRCVDIGIDKIDGAARVAERPHLTAPCMDSHKYRRGLLAVVAGRMPGAAMLAAKSAMRAGAGFVKLMSDHSHPDAPAGLVIEDTVLDQALSDKRITAILVGPGLGRGDLARDALSCVLETGRPLVLDADALTLLDPDMIEGHDCTGMILTPHEGELECLCQNFGVTAKGKLAKARGLREATGATVLAKGADNILAASDGNIRFFPAASSWLSVAGTGDVLAGIAASRLATGEAPAAAAEQAVMIHAESARQCGTAFTSDELAESVSRAYAAFL